MTSYEAMHSPQARDFRARLRQFYADLAEVRDVSLAEARVIADRYTKFTAPAQGIEWTDVDANGRHAIWAVAENSAPDRVIQFIHGGGFTFGTAEVYKDFTGHLARATASKVLSIDYRLAPEHVHPAATEDTLAVYEWLLAEGYAPERVFFSGNSAGGGLALGSNLQAIRQGLPAPGGVIGFSALADVSVSGVSYVANLPNDIRSLGSSTQTTAALYAGGVPLDDPIVSPVFGDFTGSGPLYLSAGSDEVFLDDSIRVAARAREAGVSVMLDISPGFQHDFTIAAGAVPEVDAVLRRIGAWLRAVTDSASEGGTSLGEGVRVVAFDNVS
jgi:acetyl esterase/lipase